MSLDNSLRRLSAVVSELEKAANEPRALKAENKNNQIDLFAAQRSVTADNTLMAKTLDRTIERIENLLQVGSR